jgi:hypothetical protein
LQQKNFTAGIRSRPMGELPPVSLDSYLSERRPG